VMDGLIVPLPPGITDEMLEDGQAAAHVRISARVPPSAPPTADPGWMPVPIECRVDADRRVHCTVRWIGPAPAVDLPGACDYLVFVSVAAV